jgi:hypothetical protein
MRKLFVSILVGLGLLAASGVASASHNTTLVYNCPTNKTGVRTNVTYTVPSYWASFYERELQSRGCVKVSSAPTPH